MKKILLMTYIVQSVHLHQECPPLCAKTVNNFIVINALINTTKNNAPLAKNNFLLSKSCENSNKKLQKYK